MYVNMYVCVPAHGSLKAEPGHVLWNRELTEHSQTSGIAIVNAAAGFTTADGASGAASVLVLV